jgi:hypothetical protein
MVEGPDPAQLEEYAQQIANVIRSEIGGNEFAAV